MKLCYLIFIVVLGHYRCPVARKEDRNHRAKILWPAIIFFALWFLSSFFLSFFSSLDLSGRRLDVCHTSSHGVALVRI